MMKIYIIKVGVRWEYNQPPKACGGRFQDQLSIINYALSRIIPHTVPAPKADFMKFYKILG
jgi:hypothetical protein